jgi:phytoene dehydrogenase-like protein
MDVYFTFKNLLENHHIANKILKKERSSSALIFYWGINKDFEELDIHNILFSNSYEKEFQHIFKHNNFSTDPTIYINITSKAEPEIHAPKGKQNWFVMINVTSSNKINWEDKIDEYKQIVVKKINKHLKTNIEEFIETENILHPNKIETNTNAFSGSLYGTSSNSKLAAFLRPANFNKSYKGLYFVGGTVHPGGGIPLCLKSAEIVSKLVK